MGTNDERDSKYMKIINNFIFYGDKEIYLEIERLICIPTKRMGSKRLFSVYCIN